MTQARVPRVVYELQGMRCLAAIVPFALAAGGCGHHGNDEYEVPYPAVALSSGGTFHLEATTPDGEPLVRGVHAFDLVVERADDGAPATGLAIAVKPWMPAMGHGSPYDGDALEVSAGAYRIENVSFFMAGLWELRLTLEPTDEHATLAFEVR